MSNLIRQKIIAAIEKLAIPPKGAPSIVLFLLEGEEHEIGLLLASFMTCNGSRYYAAPRAPCRVALRPRAPSISTPARLTSMKQTVTYRVRWGTMTVLTARSPTACH